jgi:hypothetical protein
VTSKSPVGDISVVTLIRTDTTLDHSQKAEKVWQTWSQITLHLHRHALTVNVNGVAARCIFPETWTSMQNDLLCSNAFTRGPSYIASVLWAKMLLCVVLRSATPENGCLVFELDLKRKHNSAHSSQPACSDEYCVFLIFFVVAWGGAPKKSFAN